VLRKARDMSIMNVWASHRRENLPGNGGSLGRASQAGSGSAIIGYLVRQNNSEIGFVSVIICTRFLGKSAVTRTSPMEIIIFSTALVIELHAALSQFGG
jgi:hypothetical protein